MSVVERCLSLELMLLVHDRETSYCSDFQMTTKPTGCGQYFAVGSVVTCVSAVKLGSRVLFLSAYVHCVSVCLSAQNVMTADQKSM